VIAGIAAVWFELATRIADGIDARSGELIQIRDCCGRYEIVQAVCLALSLRGAAVTVEVMPPALMTALWREGHDADLGRWEYRRSEIVERIDRIIVLAGDRPEPGPGRDAWTRAELKLNAIEEERRLPYLLVCVPTARRAYELGLSPADLDARVLPGLMIPAVELRQAVTQAEATLTGSLLELRTPGCLLTLNRGSRPWLSDDGVIDAADRARGAIVSNLPAGSIYTAPLEHSAQGTLRLPVLRHVADVVLRFEAGRIIGFENVSGVHRLELNAWLDSHTGEPRRLSHVGIGLNRAVTGTLGWTVVDEHRHGAVFVALGENRYMGGENASSLNADFVLSADASLVESPA
jgi:leucyl aminopeptidase (aminopeptidase T)